MSLLKSPKFRSPIPSLSLTSCQFSYPVKHAKLLYVYKLKWWVVAVPYPYDWSCSLSGNSAWKGQPNGPAAGSWKWLTAGKVQEKKSLKLSDTENIFKGAISHGWNRESSKGLHWLIAQQTIEREMERKWLRDFSLIVFFQTGKS